MVYESRLTPPGGDKGVMGILGGGDRLAELSDASKCRGKYGLGQ